MNTLRISNPLFNFHIKPARTSQYRPTDNGFFKKTNVKISRSFFGVWKMCTLQNNSFTVFAFVRFSQLNSVSSSKWKRKNLSTTLHRKTKWKESQRKMSAHLSIDVHLVRGVSLSFMWENHWRSTIWCDDCRKNGHDISEKHHKSFTSELNGIKLPPPIVTIHIKSQSAIDFRQVESKYV